MTPHSAFRSIVLLSPIILALSCQSARERPYGLVFQPQYSNLIASANLTIIVNDDIGVPLPGTPIVVIAPGHQYHHQTEANLFGRGEFDGLATNTEYDIYVRVQCEKKLSRVGTVTNSGDDPRRVFMVSIPRTACPPAVIVY